MLIMLNVQTYLLTHSLTDLAKDHGVYARFSTKNPHKFTLNYDQIEARDSDVISQECRGLVLSTAAALGSMDVVVGETEILARPMNRFFNHGQGACAEVDFDHPETRFYEKLDGTLCIVYFDAFLGAWCVATRSVPDADLTMDSFEDQTFSDLFWKAFVATGGIYNFEKGFTYSFELCTPDNQVVVRYNDYKVYLLAVRAIDHGDEFYPECFWANGLGVPSAQSYKFGSITDMVNFVSGREPSKFEGIVVCDPKFNRCKVKNAGYLALNKIKDSVAKSPRSVLEIILLGQEDDVMPLVSDRVQARILQVKEGLRSVIHTVDEEYDRLHHPDRKTFALAVQAGSGLLAPHMMRWGGKCKNTHDWISTQRKDGTWSASFLDSLLRMCDNAGK